MTIGTLSNRARWHAVVNYRTGFDPLTVEMFLRELEISMTKSS